MTADARLDAVGAVLADAFGISLSSGLSTTLEGGLAGAAAALGVAPPALAERVVARDPAALQALVEHAVVTETFFWRHHDQLAALSALAARAPGPLSIWSAGCASGEEPYSVAMVLLEAGRRAVGDRILATDVSERMLAAARSATYGAWTMRHLPAPLARRWIPGGRVAEAVRARVELRRHNLVADPPPGAFDVVLCRNVLIYFDPAVAAAVVRGLAEAVRPGGLLVLGPVELALATPLGLEWVDEGDATLLRRPG
jgi:chemotaxis protein methyltransferase CheR